MQVGDLVKHNQSEDILVVVGMKESHGGNKGMIRCYIPHRQDYYWFCQDHLEVICK